MVDATHIEIERNNPGSLRPPACKTEFYFYTTGKYTKLLPSSLADIEKELLEANAQEKDKIHIRMVKRSGRHFVTTVEGLEQSTLLDLVKYMKVSLHCSGCIRDGQIVLTGDHRKTIGNILVERGIEKANIAIHGL